jgi:hypothetical protein
MTIVGLLTREWTWTGGGGTEVFGKDEDGGDGGDGGDEGAGSLHGQTACQIRCIAVDAQCSASRCVRVAVCGEWCGARWELGSVLQCAGGEGGFYGRFYGRDHNLDEV